MLYKTKIVTPAAAQAVTTQEAKDHMHVDASTEDVLIASLIKTATEYCEKRMGRAIINQTWKMYLDEFPAEDTICLRYPPLASVTAITYYDSSNNVQTWNASNYDVDTISEPGIVKISTAGTGYPGTYTKPNAVIIEYVAGYGAASTNVPEIIREAIKLLVSHWFENREAVQTIGSVQNIPIPKAVDDLLGQYTVRQMI